MNAPEKIYLDPSDRAGEEYDAEWSVIPGVEGGVEYTRTDAFIDKACGFLREHGDLANYEIFDPDSRTYVMDYEKLIDDFKNYMKGESK